MNTFHKKLLHMDIKKNSYVADTLYKGIKLHYSYIMEETLKEELHKYFVELL